MTVRGTGLVALAALAGCGERAPAPPSPPAAASYATRAVVEGRLAELEREVGAPAPVDGAPEPELEDRLEGLVTMVSGARADLADVALEEAAGLGRGALAPLLARLEDRELPTETWRAAARVAAALGEPEAVERLLAITCEDPDPWRRAQAAWCLGEAGRDWVVPALCQRLRYETEVEPLRWVADTLVRLGNRAGLERLLEFALEAYTDEVRERATSALWEVAAAHDAETPDALLEPWRDGSLEAEGEPSARWRLEVWRRIAALAEWQLRGVDDARYVLAHLDARAAPELAAALRDDDVYVRVHTAQALARMGPRGRAAGPALVEALDDPRLAPDAALALGSIGHRPAAPALAARLAATEDPGLRVSAAIALGGVGGPEDVPDLAALLAPGELVDVRAAAAGTLLALGAEEHERVAARLLAELCTSPAVDPAVAERSLDAWLRRAAAAEPTPGAAAEHLAAWEAAAGPPDRPADADARREARAELVRGWTAR